MSRRWPEQLWIVRHGQSAGNVARDSADAAGMLTIDIAERDIDVPLSKLGVDQARALGDWFSELPPECRPCTVLTSPYVRAQQTVAYIQERGGLHTASHIFADERLREREFGILDRLTRLGIEQKFPEQAAARTQLGKFYHRPPGGESWCDVILRLRTLLDTISLHHSGSGSRVLIVAHQVVVLCLRYLLEDLSEEAILRIDREEDVVNCGVTEYRLRPVPTALTSDDAQLQLVKYNFVAPLENAGTPVTAQADTPARTTMNDKTAKLTKQYLERIPLPELDEAGDKNDRGIVLAIGGSDCVPGAVMLAGIGALRAGAGKLQLATVRRAAMPLAIAIPEALVVALPTSKSGEIAVSATGARLQPHVAAADTVLFGPGMSDNKTCFRLLEHFVPHLKPNATLVLDSAAIVALRHDMRVIQSLPGRVIVTPHAGEMASLMGIEKTDVQANPLACAQECAVRFGVVVVLKGDETFIAETNAPTLQYRGGNVGLATSGSGDTLAGIIAGISARGAKAYTAAAWGVWSHGSAGNKLSKSVGSVGYLASELLAEIPQLLSA